MNNKTEYSEILSNIKNNSKYLKLAYSFHNAKQLLNEHSTLNSSLYDFYNDLLQKEADIRFENGKENRIRQANFPYRKYLTDLDRKCLPEDAQKN